MSDTFKIFHVYISYFYFLFHLPACVFFVISPLHIQINSVLTYNCLIVALLPYSILADFMNKFED